jgi:CDP-diacylglycerol---glycerol-3-phosphate 3-phosphatidyltransferase
MEHKLTTEDIKKERIFTLPNIISAVRVALLPVFIFFSIQYRNNPNSPEYLYGSLAVVAMAITSDFLDGFVARLLKQESVIGRYLDPVCDKIVTIGGLFVVVLYYGFPLPILFLYIIRELLGVWLGTFLFFKRGIQGRPNIWGKLGVTNVAISVTWYVSSPYLLSTFGSNSLLNQPWLSAYALVFILVAGSITYTISYWDIVFYIEE